MTKMTEISLNVSGISTGSVKVISLGIDALSKEVKLVPSPWSHMDEGIRQFVLVNVTRKFL